MNVTVATEAARNLFGWSHAQLEEAVRGVPPGADGLLFLPYLQGERTPNLPRGTGVFHGLTTRTMTPAHMARATMEGVTLGLLYGLHRMRTLGIAPTEIRLTGGGSKSAIWRQICADVFGCRVVTLAEAEGAALGAAIQALAAAETKKSISGLVKRTGPSQSERHHRAAREPRLRLFRRDGKAGLPHRSFGRTRVSLKCLVAVAVGTRPSAVVHSHALTSAATRAFESKTPVGKTTSRVSSLRPSAHGPTPSLRESSCRP